MKFSISTILWIFALFATAMATFGVLGILITIAVICFWTIILNDSRPKVVELLVVTAIVSTIIGLTLPAVEVARESARRMSCSGKMSQIAYALSNYHESVGNFPRVSEVGPDGNLWHSWRLWICPYIGSNTLFANYRQDEPWNGPNYSKLTAECYECPTHSYDGLTTNYFAVVGTSTAWPLNQGRKMTEFKDGAANTILFLESPHRAIPWSKPEDLSFEKAVSMLSNPLDHHYGHLIEGGFFHKSSRGIHIAFADRSVKFVRLPISREEAIALLTVDGEEELSKQDILRMTGAELNYERIYSFGIFVLVSLLPIRKLWRNRISVELGDRAKNS